MKGFGEVWVRRPVLWILSAYIAGLAASIRFKTEPVYLWLGMILALLIALLGRRKALFPMLLGLALLFGCFRGALFFRYENPLLPFIGQRVTLQGTVQGAPQVEPDRTVYVLHVKAVVVGKTVYPADAQVKVSHYLETSYSEGIPHTPNASSSEKQNLRVTYNAGDLLQASGVLKEPSGPRNPKGFDYKGYLARRGIYSTLSVTGTNLSFVRNEASFSLNRMFAWIRSRAEAALDRSVGGREGDLLKAMLLGQRWLIEPRTENDFTRTGLAHILAISGLHIGYIVLLLSFLCNLIQLKRWTALIFQTTFLVFYCALVGAAPSVIRAVTMAVIYFAGKALGRKTDMINSAGVAALVILMLKPMDFQEVGFQLSFIAVCSIALFRNPIRKQLKFLPSGISSGIAVTLSAQIGTLPLILYYFNLLSPFSILTNLMVIPILGFAVLGGFVTLPCAMILPGIAGLLGIPVRLACRLALFLTGLAANLPYAYIRVISPSIAVILVFYIVTWLVSRERPSFIKKPYFVCFLFIGALLAGQLTTLLLKPKELKIAFLDVGQGDCSFIQTPDGKNILIDGGGRQGANIRKVGLKGSNNDTGKEGMDSGEEDMSSGMAGSGAGEDTVVPFLLKNGISSLDLVILSHSHDDHIGGLIPVLEQIKVRTFMEYPPGKESPGYQSLKGVIKQKGIEAITASRGQSYRVGEEVWLHILYPDERVVQALSKGNENNYSLVILMEYRDTSVVFSGDIESGVEYYLAGRLGKQADILKIPHHGSNTSSTKPFLDAVSPNTGIIQVGTNLFGHPNPQTLERLKERDVQVYRNDEQGAILLNYRDQQWRIRTMLSE